MNKKILVIWIGIIFGHGYSVAEELSAYTLRDINLLHIARHEETIAKREFRFSLLRDGIKIGSIAMVVVGAVSMYRWAHSGITATDADIVGLQKTATDNTKVLRQIAHDLSAFKEQTQPDAATALLKLQLAAKEAENKALRESNGLLHEAANKPFFTGIPGGFVAWLKYIINNSIIGTAVASGAYVIAQHGLPAIFSSLDSVFYTFSYPWFVKNRTHMAGCFEELERAAYAYDNHQGQEAYQRRIVIWAFNQLIAECEYTIAFMRVQNKALEAYSFVHARHMGVVTKHFMEVVQRYKEAAGMVKVVPEGYANWTDFVKAFRDKLRIEGESYAQNESYIFSRIEQGTTQA